MATFQSIQNSIIMVPGTSDYLIGLGLEIRVAISESSFNHILTTEPWESYLNSIGLSGFVCEMDRIIVITT